MNRPFTFYPNTLSLGPTASSQAPGTNAEWRLVFKDQFEKFAHSMEVQIQQQLQNYTSSIEILLSQQGLVFQRKLDDMQQILMQQLVHGQNMLIENLNKQNSHLQSQKDNFSNAAQKIKMLQTSLEKQFEAQSRSIANSHIELMKIINSEKVKPEYATPYHSNTEVGGKFSPSNFAGFIPGYGLMQGNGNVFGSNSEFGNAGDIKEFIPSFSAQPSLSTQSSLSVGNASVCVSTQSVDLDTAQGQIDSSSIKNAAGKKKSPQKKTSKAISIEPDRANAVSAAEKNEKRPVVNSAAGSGKKSKSNSLSKNDTLQKGAQTAKSREAKSNSLSPSPNQNSMKKSKAASLSKSELLNNGTNVATQSTINVPSQDVSLRALNNITPDTNLPSPSKKKAKKKKKKAITQTSNAVVDKLIQQKSASAEDPKDILVNVLNGQRLHVNVVFLLSQLQSNLFQNVQDLLVYMEKEKEFHVNDCWVECC